MNETNIDNHGRVRVDHLVEQQPLDDSACPPVDCIMRDLDGRSCVLCRTVSDSNCPTIFGGTEHITDEPWFFGQLLVNVDRHLVAIAIRLSEALAL